MNTLMMIAAGLLGLTFGGMILFRLFWIVVEILWDFASEIAGWIIFAIIIGLFFYFTKVFDPTVFPIFQ